MVRVNKVRVRRVGEGDTGGDHATEIIIRIIIQCRGSWASENVPLEHNPCCS